MAGGFSAASVVLGMSEYGGMLKVPIATESSFRDLVASLGCTPRRILDVGAGGFVGETTTVHLVELFPTARITAVEYVAERIDPLRERFGPRLDVVQADIADYQPDAPFELVVVDFDLAVLHGRFRIPFDDVFIGLTAPGGILVTDMLVNHHNAFHGPQGTVSPDAEQPLLEFLDREFGTTIVTPEVLVTRLADHPTLEPLALVEKWRGDSSNFVGWAAFRRR